MKRQFLHVARYESLFCNATKMKKIFVILMLIGLSGTLMAYTSIAATDNFMAAKINPAAISFGNA
jgi:hypothetical protein